MNNSFLRSARRFRFCILHSAFGIGLMSDPAPNAELLQSLGRLARGLSALFWGLPLALFLCVQTAKTDWLRDLNVFPPLAATGLVLYGLWQLGHFQKQERPWRSALDRAKLLALINFGLSPFLYWWNHIPTNPFYCAAVSGLALSSLLFLLSLNSVLLRLGQILPDETLRLETRQFSAFNRVLLSAASTCAIIFFVARRFSLPLPGLENYLTLLEKANLWLGIFLILLPLAVFVLLPLAMTLALIWKIKEVILDSVFRGK
jgi:hypothetical protein